MVVTYDPPAGCSSSRRVKRTAGQGIEALRARFFFRHMRFCRKIFANHLLQSGIQAEAVDLLQGRVAQSVLVKLYLVPMI